MPQKINSNSQWVGLVVYLLAQLVLPALKLAGLATYTWWVASSLFWAPVALLLVMIFLGVVFKAGTGYRAPE